MHMLILVHVFNPLVSLTLRVDDQGPPSAVEDENTIVDGQGVSWQSVLLPVSDLHFFR